MEILLQNGRIFLESGVIERGYLLLRDGIIISVGPMDITPSLNPSSLNSSPRETIDLNGLIVLPGLIDIHTHGILNINILNCNEADIARMLGELIKYGVTGFLPTTMAFPLDRIINQVKNIKRVKDTHPLGSMILGVHLEGPWLSIKKRGAHAEKHLLIPQKKDIERVVEEIGDIVKTVTFSPEIENAPLLTEMLAQNGIIPVIGHTAATYKETMAVIERGARHVTHTFDAMHGFGEKGNEPGVMETGVETAVLINDSVSIELIGCPIHVPLPFFKLVDKIKPEDKKILITDAGIGTGMPNGTIVEIEPGRKAYVDGGVLRLTGERDPKLNGGLAGSAVTMNVALKRLVTLANIPLYKAIRWASSNPAILLGINNIMGSIRPGKKANITIINDNFKVKFTILEGKIVYRGD